MSVGVRNNSSTSNGSSGISLSPQASPESIDDVYALPKEETLRLRKKHLG